MSKETIAECRARHSGLRIGAVMKNLAGLLTWMKTRRTR